MPDHASLSLSDAASKRRVTMVTGIRYPAQDHPRNSPVDAPHASSPQRLLYSAPHRAASRLTSKARNRHDKTSGGCNVHISSPHQISNMKIDSSSVSERHRHGHRHCDPIDRRSAGVAPKECASMPLLSTSPAPATKALGPRRAQHRYSHQDHSSHGVAGASARHGSPTATQVLVRRGSRGASGEVLVEKRGLAERLPRHHHSRRLSPSISVLPSAPKEEAISVARLLRFNASSSQALSSRRTTSRIRRLLCKLEAEAQRMGCPPAGVADGSSDILDLYRALFLQALADSATWERRAHALETSARASAKREAHLTRQLQQARYDVGLLGAYVEGVLRMKEDHLQRAASGTSAPTAAKMMSRRHTTLRSPGALAETAIPATAMHASLSSTCQGSPRSRDAVSEPLRGSPWRSLHLAYGVCDSVNRHNRNAIEAQEDSGSASDDAVQIGARSRKAVAQGPVNRRPHPSSHAESLNFVRRVSDSQRRQTHKEGEADRSSAGLRASYLPRRTASENKEIESAVRDLPCHGTDVFMLHTPSDQVLSSEARASKKSHRSSTASHLPTDITAELDTVTASGLFDTATPPSSVHSSFDQPSDIETPTATDSVVSGSAPLSGSAAASCTGATSAVHSLLELLRSRDAAKGVTSERAEGCIVPSFDVLSKEPSQISARRHSVDYEVTVLGATRSCTSGSAACPKPTIPAMASSLGSLEASRPPRGSTEAQGYSKTHRTASHSSSASASQPSLSGSRVLIPYTPLLRRGVEGGGSGSGDRVAGNVPTTRKRAATAAPIHLEELMNTLLPSSSLEPNQPFVRHIDAHEGNSGSAARFDRDCKRTSCSWESLEPSNSLEDSSMSSLSLPNKNVEEPPAAHHHHAIRSDASDGNIRDERGGLYENDNYAEWRARLELQLNNK